MSKPGLCPATVNRLNELGKSVDRLVMVDVPARGIVGELYDSARRKSRGPLTLQAAEALTNRIHSGDVVLLLSGFQTPGWDRSETDGPVGSIMLAHSLRSGLGASPAIITDASNVPLFEAASRSARLTGCLQIVGIQAGEDVEDEAERLFSRYAPSAVIAVERPGWNVKRIYHNMRGQDISHLNAHLDPIFHIADRRNTLTIGVGDGGNEIGMGNIIKTVRRIVPYGKKCNCPCKSGVAATTKADVTVTAAISNWGAYGIAACLSAILESPDAFPGRRLEHETLRACLEAGSYDSVLNCRSLSVDGVPAEVSGNLLDLLNAAVKSWMRHQ